MKPIIRIGTIASLLLFLVSSCAVLKGKKEIDHLKFVYDTNAKINYGQSFSLKTYAVYVGGKEKNITSKKDLVITVSGAFYNNGRIRIESHPEALRADTIYVKAEYRVGEKVYSLSEAIPFNYKGDLEIMFKGQRGQKGINGKDGSTPLIFRDGKDGENGGQGEIGGNGADLTVNIWKEENNERYRIKVLNLVTNKTYNYTYKDNGYGIRFNVNGGIGGNGGNGGDGGKGKNGEITEKKRKRPGDGGNGGNAGDGGQGGTGGTVYVFLHPNAEELRNKIAVYNFGGEGGQSGVPGEPGVPGTPEDGQDPGTDGVQGADGAPGAKGLQGMPLQLVVEDFDIEQ